MRTSALDHVIRQQETKAFQNHLDAAQTLLDLKKSAGGTGGTGLKKVNKWIQHVKQFATKNKMKYHAALKHPKCKETYIKGGVLTGGVGETAAAAVLGSLFASGMVCGDEFMAAVDNRRMRRQIGQQHRQQRRRVAAVFDGLQPELERNLNDRDLLEEPNGEQRRRRMPMPIDLVRVAVQEGVNHTNHYDRDRYNINRRGGQAIVPEYVGIPTATQELMVRQKPKPTTKR